MTTPTASTPPTPDRPSSYSALRFWFMFTLLLAGVVTLGVGVFGFWQHVLGGEVRVMVDGLVTESTESIARPWPPGSRWYAARVAYETQHHGAQQQWVYGLEALLPVGSHIQVGYKRNDPQRIATPEFIASQREEALWFPLLGFGLLGLAWLLHRGGRADASPTARYLPGVFVTALVMLSMLPTIWVLYVDLQRQQAGAQSSFIVFFVALQALLLVVLMLLLRRWYRSARSAC